MSHGQRADLRERSVVASQGGVHALDVNLWRDVAQHELHGVPELLQGRQKGRQVCMACRTAEALFNTCPVLLLLDCCTANSFAGAQCHSCMLNQSAAYPFQHARRVISLSAVSSRLLLMHRSSRACGQQRAVRRAAVGGGYSKAYLATLDLSLVVILVGVGQA